MRLVQVGILTIILSGLALMSCSNKKDTSNGFAPDLKLEKATVQKSMSGVNSNLRSTDVYLIYLSGNMPLPTKFDSLLVDDIRIPISSIQSGSSSPSTTLTTSGEVEELIIHAKRNNYNEDGPKAVEEVEYAKSGKSLGDGGVLQYRAGGQHYTIKIDSFEKLETIRNP